MILRYRYRIYPNKAQKTKMRAAGNTCRFLYNYFLKVNQDEYQKTNSSGMIAFAWYVWDHSFKDRPTINWI